MAFSFAVAALIDGRIDAAWARWVRPWTLAAWMFLTLGIAMGSWWAYYELGWGGFWFWDPVENASFMPWLAGTALLHSALVMEKRDALKVWTVLLAIITFSLSLMGAFLVRSGVLTSVHAFAVDPERGVFILGIMAVFIGGSFALFAWRAPTLSQGGLFAPISREGALVLNNLLLTVSCAAVFVGTLYPLALEAVSWGKDLGWCSVLQPHFCAVDDTSSYGCAIRSASCLEARRSTGCGTTPDRCGGREPRGNDCCPRDASKWPMAGAAGRRSWSCGSSLAPRPKSPRVQSLTEVSLAESCRRIRNLPRAAYGTALAHAGLGVMVLGLVGTTAWRSERIEALVPGGTVDIAGYEITFQGVKERQGPNYKELAGLFAVTRNGQPVITLIPSKRAYSVEKSATTEAGIYNSWRGDLYIVLGDPLKDGGYSVRVYFNPLVRLIWLGALLMFFGVGACRCQTVDCG